MNVRGFFAFSILLASFLSLNIAFADTTPKFTSDCNQPPDEVKCDEVDIDGDGKIDNGECTYITQNTTAAELIRRLETRFFGGTSQLSEDAHITTNGVAEREFSFWHKNADLRKIIAATIPGLDHCDNFAPTYLVDLRVDVYTSTEDMVNTIQAAALKIDASKDLGTNKVFDLTSGAGLTSQINMGAAAFGSLLRMGRDRQEISVAKEGHIIVGNMQTIPFVDGRTLHRAFPNSAASPAEMLEGLKFDATVTVSGNDNNRVMLKNFKVTYGREMPGSTVLNPDVRNVGFQENYIVLEPGRVHAVVGTNEETTIKKKSFGILSFGKSTQTTRNKFLIVVQATPMSLAEFASMQQQLRMHDAINEKLVSSEINKLKKDVSLEKILEKITPQALTGLNGNKSTTFYLDKDLLSSQNYNQQVRVTVSADGGYKQSGVRRVDVLAISGYTFEIPVKILKKLKLDMLELTVTLEAYSTTTAKSPNIVKVIPLHYNPQVNDFVP